MRTLRNCWLAVLAALSMAAAAPALAQPAPPAVSPPATTGQQAQDETTVKAAKAALARGGFNALKDFLPQLNEIAARAPTIYPRVDVRDGTMTVRAPDDNPNSSVMNMVLGALAAGSVNAGKDADPSTLKVKLEFNTYIEAILLRGSYAVEMKAPEVAIQVLDKGLALQPDNVRLNAEKGQALALLNRWQDMFDIYNHAIGANWAFVLPQERALLLRGRGFALTELARLDEAEASYRESLTLEPNNPTALNELTYLARLKAGGPRAPMQQTAPGVPGSPQPPAPPPPALKGPIT